jgi:hypothetical protein
MSDQFKDAAQERSEALFREWHAKRKALAELQARFASGSWGWPHAPFEPVPLRDADSAIREMQAARDAERLAWHTYIESVITLV